MSTHSFTCKQAIPAFTPQPQSITAVWLVLIYHPTERTRLCRPGWLLTYTEIKWRPRESNPDTITHPSTNRARRRLTSLIKTNALPLRQTATAVCLSEMNHLRAHLAAQSLTVTRKVGRGRTEREKEKKLLTRRQWTAALCTLCGTTRKGRRVSINRRDNECVLPANWRRQSRDFTVKVLFVVTVDVMESVL